MTDREKVIKGLEHCLYWEKIRDCTSCQYYAYRDEHNGCANQMKKEAIALLKEQEEQIKNRDESLEKAREEIKWLRGMLKEQEPVKVKDYADIVDRIQVGYCPKCDRKIVWNPEKEETVAFCKYCGKRVKWNA